MEILLPDAPGVRRDLVSVYGMYVSLLGRRPDKGGLVNAAASLMSGEAPSDIERGIRVSDEYRNRALRVPGDAGSPAATILDVLDVMFDGGVPVANRSAYAWWRDEMNARSHRSGERPGNAARSVTFMLPVGPGLGDEAARTIESIIGQREGSWRIALIVGPWRLSKVLRHFRRDERIAVVRRGPWPLARASTRTLFRNSGSAMICLLHPGDLVSDVAVASILSGPDADIVMSDGDRLGRDGRTHSPELVGAWDPDAYLTREPPGLVAVRSAILRKVWKPDWAGGGAQHGWECCLAAAAHASAGAIRHVPAILLHRAPREAAIVPRLGVLQAFLRDVHEVPAARVETDTGTVRVVFPVPRERPLASIVVPSRDQPTLLRNCVEGVLGRTAYANVDVVIVDNGSVTKAARSCLLELDQDPRTAVIRLEVPFNWGALNAAGVAASRGDVVVFLNDDIDVVDPGWLDEMVSQALRPDVGLVGAKLLYPSGGIQHAGIVIDKVDAVHVWRDAPGDYAGPHDQLVRRRTVGAVTGACMAMRRSVYDQVGGFEQENLAVTWGDIDLCLRVRKHGYRVVWTPFALLHHVEQATRGADRGAEKLERIAREHAFMMTQWGTSVVDDPFFSPNMNPKTAVPTLRTRPK